MTYPMLATRMWPRNNSHQMAACNILRFYSILQRRYSAIPRHEDIPAVEFTRSRKSRLTFVAPIAVTAINAISIEYIFSGKNISEKKKNTNYILQPDISICYFSRVVDELFRFHTIRCDLKRSPRTPRMRSRRFFKRQYWMVTFLSNKLRFIKRLFKKIYK